MYKQSWKSHVYKKQPHLTPEEKEDWLKVRRFVLERDKQTCLRCDKHFRAQKDLSVHHLVPRSNDGSNDPSNLVTLCQPCHDYVEINDLRTAADIIGSFDDGIIKTLKVKPEFEKIETFSRPEWHKYVYGGMRK